MFLKSPSDYNIKSEFKYLNFILFSSYIIIVIISSICILYFNYFFQEKLAKSYTLSTRNNLIINDLRQSVTSLNSALSESFIAIEVRNDDATLIFLPNISLLENIKKDFLTGHTTQVITADQLNSNSKPILYLDFYYSNKTPLFITFFSEFFLLIVFIFILHLSKRRIVEKHNLLLKQKEIETAQILSKQVSHDIRSPLSALNMIIGSLKNIPEDQRIIMRSASSRINDIANELLFSGQAKHKTSDVKKKVETKLNNEILLSIELLPALIDVLVTEKRIQFREKSNITIETEFDDSYGAFVKINSVEFKRVISNLINNSVEALKRDDGRIIVAIRRYSSKTILSIRDNGNGIPPHILEKLGQMGVTHGKEGTDSGSGLGVYHAKKTIMSFGAEFEINSQEGMGTEIKMEFPKPETPNWFVSELQIKSSQLIVALDDDQSILGVWKQRIKELNNSQIKLITLTSENDFFEWIENNKANIEATLFLMDFELLNQKNTGLDLIEKFKLTNAILVTSRYEESSIRKRCDLLGVRQIPKGMAPFVPIDILRD